MAVCQVCQKDNPAGAEYCEDCGASLATPVGAGVGAGASAGTSASAEAAASTPHASGAGTSDAPASPLPSVTAGSQSVPVSTGTGAAGASAPATTTGQDAAPAAPATGASTQAEPASGEPASGEPEGAATAGGAVPAGTTPGGQTARLVALRYGAPTGEEVPLMGQRLVVGRFDPETGPVDIDLSSAGEAVHISRQHGELYREADGRWMVRDLGSTNGIFVKGTADTGFGPRITAPRALTDGDEVAFGNARFVFRTQ